MKELHKIYEKKSKLIALLCFGIPWTVFCFAIVFYLNFDIFITIVFSLLSLMGIFTILYVIIRTKNKKPMLIIYDDRIEVNDLNFLLQWKYGEYYYKDMNNIVLYRDMRSNVPYLVFRYGESKKKIKIDVAGLEVSAEDIMDIIQKNYYSHTIK